MIFAETGVLLGLIIPGGKTLIFTSGILVSADSLEINIFLLLLLMIVAGYGGDCSGYYIGKRFGRKLYHKEYTWYFKKKHKRSAVLLGKFMPVICPFTSLILGITHLRLSYFLTLSLLSVTIYMSAFLLGGYYLGSRFPQIKN